MGHPLVCWWLRDAANFNTTGFYFINPNGSVSVYDAERDYGISPAFRIA